MKNLAVSGILLLLVFFSNCSPYDRITDLCESLAGNWVSENGQWHISIELLPTETLYSPKKSGFVVQMTIRDSSGALADFHGTQMYGVATIWLNGRIKPEFWNSVLLGRVDRYGREHRFQITLSEEKTVMMLDRGITENPRGSFLGKFRKTE